MDSLFSYSEDLNIELVKLAKNGDENAFNRLVDVNKGLIHYFVKENLKKGPSAEELRQIALIGIFTALEKFDPERKVKFMTYAHFYMKNELSQIIKESYLIRPPESKEYKKYIRKILYHSEQFQILNGRRPSSEEISDLIGIEDLDSKKIKKYLSYWETIHVGDSVRKVQNLDKEENLINLYSTGVTYEKSVIKEEVTKGAIRFLLEKIIMKQTEKRQVILKLFFNLGEHGELTFEEIKRLVERGGVLYELKNHIRIKEFLSEIELILKSGGTLDVGITKLSYLFGGTPQSYKSLLNKTFKGIAKYLEEKREIKEEGENIYLELLEGK